MTREPIIAAHLNEKKCCCMTVPNDPMHCAVDDLYAYENSDELLKVSSVGEKTTESTSAVRPSMGREPSGHRSPAAGTAQLAAMLMSELPLRTQAAIRS